MVDDVRTETRGAQSGHSSSLPRIPVAPLGISLSVFLALTYGLCALFLVLFPDLPISHSFLGLVLPWFKPLGGYDLLMGGIEVFVLGWYVALVFGPLYNFTASRYGS